ncbi:MAG: class I SAM-dependent methyltransferase, partial [Prevotellaceae bacterium]|nr:class I SAM-dependent methyltransferase [Prevotellaceae bacterium]
EDVGVDFFRQLEANDILFIDSSHVIRPQGDVLFEYLELLPTLTRGVIVHIHDIFSPRDYLAHWVISEVRLWNEQYLLEAFLSFNSTWKILGALNFLHHNHYDLLKEKCPKLTPDTEPGSFYIVKM